MARLLVVDDEPRYRIYLARILEGDGHEVRTAGDDAAALEALRGFEPDLLIADWMLRSKVDGVTLAAIVRRQCPGTAVLVITGHPTEELQRQLADHEFAEVLEKPFATTALREAVERALGGRPTAGC